MLLVRSSERGKCKDCGKKLKDYRSIFCRGCSKIGKRNPIYGRYGKEHPNWKGGYIHKTLGYKFIHIENKKIYEHRAIMEKFLGRKLNKKEVIHHIDEDKLNNNIENLLVVSEREHRHIHQILKCYKK